MALVDASATAVRVELASFLRGSRHLLVASALALQVDAGRPHVPVADQHRHVSLAEADLDHVVAEERRHQACKRECD